MKRGAVFCWLIGIVVIVVAIVAAFHFDAAVAQSIVSHQTPGMRGFMENVSRLGDWPTHFLVGLGLIALAQWKRDKKWTRILVAMLIALSLAGLTGRLIKISTGRARPSVKTDQMWNGPVSGSKYHSFPSGHVDASMGFFGVLLLVRRRIGLACLPIPLLIGFSRLYLGAHYLSDVVCGAVLGILAAILVTHFYLLRRNKEQDAG